LRIKRKFNDKIKIRLKKDLITSKALCPRDTRPKVQRESWPIALVNWPNCSNAIGQFIFCSKSRSDF